MSGGAWPRLTWRQWSALAAYLRGEPVNGDATALAEAKAEVERAVRFRALMPSTMQDGRDTIPTY